MSNKPLANPITFTGQSPPWSLTQLDANFAASQAVINDTLTYSNYFVDQSGVANSIIISIPSTLTVSLTAGTVLFVKINNTNTGAVTCTVNALTAQSVLNADLSALTANQLLAGQVATLAYDGTRFQFLGAYTTYPVGNVLRYGADPLGVADSTTAFQNAFNAGGLIVIPAGTYKITAQLNITKSVYVFGAGKGSVTLSQSTNFTMLNISGFSGGWIVEGLTIQNTQAIGAVTSGDGVRVNNSNGVLREVFCNGTYNGIHVSNAQDVRIEHCPVWGFANNGIFFDGGAVNDCWIEDCFVNGGQGTTPTGTNGILLQDSCQALNFINCEVIYCLTPLQMGATVNATGTRPAYCKFTGCYFDSSTNAAVVDKCADMNFIGCWFSNRPNNGCTVGSSGCESVTFQACTFANCATHGCILQASALRTTFSACKFLGNSTASANGNNGLTVAANTTDFTIVGCTATNSGFAFGTQGTGILISAGTSNRYIVCDNNVTGNGVGGGFSDGGTGTSKFIQRNIGYNPIGVTAITVTASPFTYTNNFGFPIVVNINGGTVSLVTLNGNQIASATNVTATVPQGQALVVTYSSVPTMVYMGL